jgi:hypothetical protein
MGRASVTRGSESHWNDISGIVRTLFSALPVDEPAFLHVGKCIRLMAVVASIGYDGAVIGETTSLFIA